MRGWLVVFAKVPRPGRVKTRLSPPLTPEEAAALYRCLLLDVLDESAKAAAVLGCDGVIAVDPPAATEEIAAGAPRGLRAIAQSGGELGDRMAAIARQAGAAGAPYALLRGSDSPCLDRGVLRGAVEALDGADIVLCPDRDGGYNLVGLGERGLERGPRTGLFAHPMSTDTVLRDTLAGAERAGLRTRCLAPGFDVDRFDDLRWLAASRRSGAPPCPRTLAFLDAHRLWPPEAPLRSPLLSDS